MMKEDNIMRVNSKKLATLVLAGIMTIGGSTGVFAQEMQNTFTPAPPLQGYEIDITEYNTAEYNGTEPMSRVATLLSSGVTRYINHSTEQYYAKGATLVVESTTGKNIKHTTTVTLEKTNFWGGTTTLVSASETGVGEVWATTSETPTKGDPHVYWKK